MRFNNPHAPAKFLTYYEENDRPQTKLDRDIYGFNSNGVYSDDFGGAYEAVSHLISIGHRRIAIFRGPLNSRPGNERFQGYIKALQDNGITPEPELMRAPTVPS